MRARVKDEHDWGRDVPIEIWFGARDTNPFSELGHCHFGAERRFTRRPAPAFSVDARCPTVTSSRFTHPGTSRPEHHTG